MITSLSIFRQIAFRLVFCFAFSFLLVTVKGQYFGQYYTVNDEQGYVHVRATPSAGGKIICVLENEMIVHETWNEDTTRKNWMFVEFYIPKTEAKNVKSKAETRPPAVMNKWSLFRGWVYRGRLMNIEMQNELKKKWVGDDFILYNDSINIKFDYKQFEKTKHNIQMKGDYPIVKIDGHYLAGTDGGIPRYEMQNFSMEISHHKIAIPRSAFHDLYEPNFNRFTNGYIDKNGTMYITMYNSDGAGSYEVIFIFKNNKYIGRYVFDGEC